MPQEELYELPPESDNPKDKLLRLVGTYFNLATLGIIPHDFFSKSFAKDLRHRYMARETERVQSLNTPEQVLQYETDTPSRRLRFGRTRTALD